MRFFSILRDYVRPSGELVYITVSIAPINSAIRGEASIKASSFLFKKKISLINQSRDELTLALENIWGRLGEVISKSPYDTLTIKVSPFTDHNLGVNYPNAVVLTGRTAPVFTLRTRRYIQKLIEVNEELMRLIIGFLDQLSRP